MSFRARVLAAAVAATSTALLLITVQSSVALADATGCTLAPGYTGALNCVAVYGSGLHVDSSQSRYQPGISPWPQQICSRKHEWRFRRYGAAGYTTKDLPGNGCILGVAPDYVDWASPGTMTNGSSFCAHSNNTQTGGVWTPFACETITY